MERLNYLPKLYNWGGVKSWGSDTESIFRGWGSLTMQRKEFMATSHHYGITPGMFGGTICSTRVQNMLRTRTRALRPIWLPKLHSFQNKQYISLKYKQDMNSEAVRDYRRNMFFHLSINYGIKDLLVRKIHLAQLTFFPTH